MKKPAHRGATAGLSNAFRQVSIDRSSAEPHALQIQKLVRLGYGTAHAAAIAELAFTVSERRI